MGTASEACPDADSREARFVADLASTLGPGLGWRILADDKTWSPKDS